jgi:hypothetical protein
VRNFVIAALLFIAGAVALTAVAMLVLYPLSVGVKWAARRVRRHRRRKEGRQ